MCTKNSTPWSENLRGTSRILLFLLNFYWRINRKNLPVCYTDLKTKINLILTPPQSYRPRSYMQLVNTRILRHFWSKSVEKHQCYRRKTLKNVKNRVFFEFLRPPRPKIKNRASLGHAPLQYATFEGSLKKIGWETKKFMQNNVWWCPSPSPSSNGNTYIIHTGKRLTYRVFSYQLGGVLCQLVG